MPSPYLREKEKLVQELWLPLAIRGGDQLHPRRRQKQMRLFTLTDSDCVETRTFDREKLIQGSVVAWQRHVHEVWRLDSELKRGSRVLDDGPFEEITPEDEDIIENLPFDLLNLDYTSQRPTLHSEGRVEREINGGYKLIKLLKNNNARGFVLLYTTIIDDVDLYTDRLSFEFNLPLDASDPARNAEQKVEYLKNTVLAIIESNNYQIVEASGPLLIEIEENMHIFSIGLISLRRI